MIRIRLSVLVLLLVFAPLSCTSELAMGLRWEKELRNPVTAVEIVDIDGDGVNEIVAAVSEQTLTGGSGWIYVIDGNGEIKSESNVPGPPSDNLLVDDINNDGKKEIILGIYSYLHVLDSTCNTEFKSRTGYQYQVMDMEIGDANNDGLKDIAVASGTRSKNGVYIYDCNGSIIWAKGTAGRPYGVDIFDLDNDGSAEVIAATVGGRTDPLIAYPAYVYVFNSAGEELWSYKTEKGTNSLMAADIDRDGTGEILAGSWPDLNVLDHEGNIEWKYTTGGRIHTLAVEDINKDGSNEVIVGSNNVYVLTGSGELLCENPVGSEVYSLAVMDIDGDGRAEIIAGSDRLYILDSECNKLWDYKTGLSVRSISIGDLDNDGYYEVVIGSADHRLYVFGSKEHVMGSSADEAYSQAQKLYLAGENEQALEHSTNARDLYQQLNDSKGVSKAELLMNQIKNAIEDDKNEVVKAAAYYGMAENLSNSGDYLNASKYLKKAIAKYSALGDLEMLSKSNSLLEKTDSMVALAADSIYNNGSQQQSEGRYMEAISTLERAKEHYYWIKDYGGTRNSDQLLAELYHAIAKQELNAGNLEEAGTYSQKARSLYLCLSGEETTYCDTTNPQIKQIEDLLPDIENRSYDGNTYQRELTELDSMLRHIASGGGSIQIIPEEYLDQLVAILGLLIVIAVIAILYVSRRGQGKKRKPKKKEKKIDRKKEAERKKAIKETEKKVEHLIKVGRPKPEVKERKKVGKINKSARKGEGVSLKKLSENG